MSTPPIDAGAFHITEHTVFVYPSDDGWTLRLTLHGGPHWLSNATDVTLERRVLDALAVDPRKPGPEWRIADDDE